MSITRLNPDTLFKSPAFTQVATVSSPVTLVFVGGQNGVDLRGQVVGPDIASQSQQAFKNVMAALDAAGATLNDVVKMTIYIAHGQDVREAYGAVQKLAATAAPPTVSVVIVAGFANPDRLVEIEAIAAISGDAS